MPPPSDPPSSGAARVILYGRRADDEVLRSAIETLRAAGHEIDVRVTWEAGDGARFTREAVAEEVSTVVAAGGDGTGREVVQGLLDASDDAPDAPLPTMGIVPLGTGNDFARAAGIPEEPIDALRLALERPSRPIDIGRMDRQHFLNMATGGFGTEATASTPDELKKALGSVAYLLTGLANMTSVAPVQVRLTGPDFEWSGPLLVLAVGNGRMAGGGHRLCPDALVDDGALDVCVVTEPRSGRFGAALRALLHGGLPELGDDVVTTRTPWLAVEAPEGLHINLDGEPISGTDFHFDLRPGRLSLHLPEDSPLLGA